MGAAWPLRSGSCSAALGAAANAPGALRTAQVLCGCTDARLAGCDAARDICGGATRAAAHAFCTEAAEAFTFSVDGSEYAWHRGTDYFLTTTEKLRGNASFAWVFDA